MITLIKNGTVISMDEKRKKEYEIVDIVIKDNIIDKIEKDYKGEYDKLIDATNKIVMPGLINSHTHLGMSIFRATNDNLTLDDWLQNKIWPIENNMNDEDVYYSALISFLEMIKTGTTCASDMYFGWKGTMKAALETNFRIIIGRCLMNHDNAADERIKEQLELQETYKNNELVNFTIAPHSMYTCTKEYLKKCALLSDNYNYPIHMHFCENKSEVANIEEQYNETPINALKEIEFLNKKLILAHGTFLNKEDLKYLKDNVSIVTNPISNLNLGCGIADLVELQKNNINICLGTDGQGSGNNLNLFKHMSLVADLQKAKYQDPTVMSAYEVLKMATINGAKAYNLDKQIGSLEEGKLADIIILDIDNIEIYPHPDLICEIVHNIESNNIVTTIINGKIIMENRKILLNINEENLKRKASEIYQNLHIK